MAQDNGRAPQALVLVNGTILPGLIDLSVEMNSHLAANRFHLTAALDAVGYAFWSGSVFVIEIRVGLAGAWASLMIGEVDHLDVDPGRGVIRVDGRDLTSRFIEARTQETFENQTASEVATTLANRRGLQAVVSPTQTLIGRDFQNGQSRVTLDQHARCTTEWDLLVHLAEEEGYDVWVDGGSLYFAPPDQNGNILELSPTGCVSIHLRRQLSLSAGLQVNVKSWDCRSQRAVVQTASSAAAGEDARSYVLIKPNLTADGAQKVAQRLLTQMSQHERSVCIEMPGDLTTMPRDILSLSDTGTDFDGEWSIMEVNRRLSLREGFVQVVEARVPAWTVF